MSIRLLRKCMIVSIMLILSVSLTACNDDDSGDEASAAGGTAIPTVASDSAPTPDDDGIYRDLTFDQAREIVPFSLIEPAELPEELGAPVISITSSPPDAQDRRNYAVNMPFPVDNGDAGPTLSEQGGLPRNAIAFSQSLGMWSDPATRFSPESTSETVEISGAQVNKVTGTDRNGDSFVIYWWSSDDVQREVMSRIGDEISEDLVEQLLASLVAGDRGAT